MPPATSMSSNPMLTSYAKQVAPSLQNSRAKLICPEVTAPSTKARFKIFDEENTWQTYKTERGIGGKATRIPWKASDGQLNLEPHALEAFIDHHELDGDDIRVLQRSRVRSTISTAILSNEKDMFTYLNANVTAKAGKGTWDSSTDPIEQIDEQLEAIELNLGGLPPNHILFSTSAWNILRNNAKIQARFKTGFVGVTKDVVQSAFLFPDCEITIGGLTYNNAKRGATQSKARMQGADVWIFYNSPSPDMEDPSFAKCFTTGRGGTQQIKTYDEPYGQVIVTEWNRQFYITNSQAVARLTVTSS